MSVEQNKATVRRFAAELLNTGDFAVADDLLAPDFAIYGFPGVPPTRAGLEQVLTAFRSAFPDWRDTIDDMVAEGEHVVVRLTGTGTHQADFMGIPPTGKQVTLSGMALYRLRDGKIVEDRVQLDMLGMLQQLGVIPAPGA
jgi:steroid delta-isomerase-like uncharacterized protein